MHSKIQRNKIIAVTSGIILICVIALYWWIKCYSVTTLILVRHADRQGSQDTLSAAGLVRAQKLVHIAEKAGIHAIYHTDRQRTQQTAEPTAMALQLTPIEIPETDVQGLVTHIYQHNRSRTVLVVGHSHTLPDIIAAAGSAAPVNIGSQEYDNLFILTVCPCKWKTKLVNLQYGAESP